MTEASSTIVFLDLVRFASLTEAHGDLAAADAATEFVEITRRSLDESARLVKTLGDGVLITAPNVRTGLSCAAEIIEHLHDLRSGLDARGGLHEGPVIERSGDVFGSTVNLAARLATVAARGSMAVSRPVALAASDLGLASTPLGHLVLPGFVEEVEVFQIDPCGHSAAWVIDPVCGMRVETTDAVERLEVPGVGVIGFCSSACRRTFDSSPERFQPPGRGRANHSGGT